jgi:hypothetical protein
VAATPAGPAFGLDDLYAVLVTRYPDTPYAERANAIRAALSGEVAAPAADSAGAAPPTPTTGPQRPGAAAAGLMGEDMIDPAQGGFTWRVARVPTPLGARALLRNFRRRGFRTAVNVDVASDGQPFYGVVVGQFESLEDAESVRDGLPVSGLGAGVEILPVEGMVFVEEEQLTETPGAVED